MCCSTNSIFRKCLNASKFKIIDIFYPKCTIRNFFQLETKTVNCILVRLYKGVLLPSSGEFTGRLVVSNCTCNCLEFFRLFLTRFFIILGVIKRSTWATLSPSNVMMTAWSFSSIDGFLGVGAGGGGGGFSSLSRPSGRKHQNCLSIWY